MTSASTSFKQPTASQQAQGKVDDPLASSGQAQRSAPAGASKSTPSEVESLPKRPQPPLAEKCLLHGTEPAADQVHVIVSQAALQQIAAHSHSNLRSELGGALLGHAYRHGETVFVDVAAALPAVSGDHGPIHFTFSADSWSELHKDRAEHYPELAIVGWFHTHPGLGVFYSSDDVVVHSAAFTLPWHVGLVVDPVRQEACFFGWVQGQLAPLDGFYEWTDQQPASVVEWQIVRTAVWHGVEGYSQEIDSPSRKRSIRGVYTPGSQWPALSPLLSWLGLISGALGLLLGFFLIVGGVLPLARQVNYLESAVLSLADESADNAAACPDARLRILTPGNGRSVSAGSRVELIGTANVPAATRYQVEVRPAGTNDWSLVDARRRDTSLGLLAEWDTALHAPALYELRLTAVDRNNVRLADVTPCLVTIELTP